MGARGGFLVDYKDIFRLLGRTYYFSKQPFDGTTEKMKASFRSAKKKSLAFGLSARAPDPDCGECISPQAGPGGLPLELLLSEGLGAFEWRLACLR